MQERLISTRIIQFGKEEIFWECQSSSQREKTVETESSLKFKSWDQHRIKRALVHMDADPLSSHGPMYIWYNIVAEYSTRDLTIPSDRLPAISGIAEKIRESSGYTYLYGLWKEDLKGLLWFRDRSDVKETDGKETSGKETGGKETGAPSWSWAARTGAISFRRLHNVESIEFEEDRYWGWTKMQI